MAGRLRAALRGGRPVGRSGRGPQGPGVPSWPGDPPAAEALDPGFFERDVLQVARDLLGCRLRSDLLGAPATSVIVEVEAYGGPEDPASHAATRTGITRRNRAMFGPPGRAYVYRSYGVHWCLNVVTGPAGMAQAVLLRGVEPLEGADLMRARRGGRLPVGAGPGRLCQALGITDALYGHDLTVPPLRVLPGWRVPDRAVGRSGRIGVRLGADRPHRLYVLGSPGVSRPAPPDPPRAENR